MTIKKPLEIRVLFAVGGGHEMRFWALPILQLPMFKDIYAVLLPMSLMPIILYGHSLGIINTLFCGLWIQSIPNRRSIRKDS